MCEIEIEYAVEEATKEYEFNLCTSLTRYCNGFIPSITNFNEVISDDNDITIIINKIYCKSGKEERILIKMTDKDTPIIMLDVVMHLIQHHKHTNHMYFEGLTRYKMNKSGSDCIKLPDNEFITTWGS